MSIIKIFYDVETTGSNPNKHSLHQIAGLIEVDEQVVDEFNIYSRPHSKAILEPEALNICKVTPGWLFILPTVLIEMQNGEEFRFAVFFSRKRFVNTLRDMGVDA